MRTSTKQCREAAELIGCSFYARDEHKLNQKVYVRDQNGVFHEFKSNTEALEFMLDKMIETLVA